MWSLSICGELSHIPAQDTNRDEQLYAQTRTAVWAISSARKGVALTAHPLLTQGKGLRGPITFQKLPLPLDQAG